MSMVRPVAVSFCSTNICVEPLLPHSYRTKIAPCGRCPKPKVVCTIPNSPIRAVRWTDDVIPLTRMFTDSQKLRRVFLWQIRSISPSGLKSLLLSACDNFSSADYRVNRFTRGDIVPKMYSRRKPQSGERNIENMLRHIKSYTSIEQVFEVFAQSVLPRCCLTSIDIVYSARIYARKSPRN